MYTYFVGLKMKVRNRDEDKIEREYGHWRLDERVLVWKKPEDFTKMIRYLFEIKSL